MLLNVFIKNTLFRQLNGVEISNKLQQNSLKTSCQVCTSMCIILKAVLLLCETCGLIWTNKALSKHAYTTSFTGCVNRILSIIRSKAGTVRLFII